MTEALKDYESKKAAEWLCKALAYQVPPEAVECIWRALTLLPDCGDEKQRIAKAAIAEKYGFKG